MNVLELSEQEIIRRNSMNELRAMGIEPYPAAEYVTNAFSTDIKAEFNDDAEPHQVSVAGRIMSRRIMGKASFIELQDSKGRIQVYITRDDICPDEDKEMYNTVFKRLLDLGDFIGIEGFVFRTQMGEISIHAKKLTVLAKSIKPLPIVKYKDGVAYDSFEDPELRYRQRYVDLIVNDGVKEKFLKRATVIKTMRAVLDEAGYTEVETPILQSIPGGASARPFITHHNSLDMDLYLRIATELYLKRLIVGGFEGVYEIGKNFRNEGMDKNHNPEFTCMELYVQYKDYNWMMSFTEKLLERICIAVNGCTETEIDGKTISFKAPYRRLPILEAIKEKTGYDLEGKSEDEIRQVCKELNNFHTAHFHHRLSRRDEPADQDAPQQAGTDRTLRTDGERQGTCQRLQRAERPDRPRRTLQRPTSLERKGRRRSDVHRPGLPKSIAIWYASHIGHRYRHRPSDHVDDGRILHPGSAFLPADASGKGHPQRCSCTIHGTGHPRRLGGCNPEGRLQPGE